VPERKAANLTLSLPEAEVIALKILGFLVSDPDRAGRFLKLTGLTANDLRTNAGDRLFLAGVVEHLLADESLLIVFAEDNGIDPRLPAMTVAVLRGRNAV
jgi:hypothetical protein